MPLYLTSVRIFCAVIATASVVQFGTSVALAQSSPSLVQMGKPTAITSSDYGLRKGSLIVAPVPFSNPMIGKGLAIGAGYLFTLPGSKPSGFGIGKMKSSNGSSGLAAAGAVSFAEGTWDVSVLAGEADVYYDLVFKGLDVPVRHNGTLIAFSVERAASQNLSFGVDFEYLETSLALNSPVFQQLPELLKPQAELDMTKITLNATYDTRDNTFFPTSGMLASAKIGYALDVSSILQGGLELERNRYNKSIFSLASYHEVGNTGVLAARGVLCSSSSQAPFFDNCGIGLASGLRGFPTMEFIDEASATAQVEYRGRINDRFGYVAFAAIGGGGPKISSLSLNEGGVSFGAGLRIRLSKKYKLDYAIDYAKNNNSEGYLYITLGQKF